MSENSEVRVPLDLYKQAAMKLDSFITDICEIKEEGDLDWHDL